jgi:hypothetical protein
MSKKTITECLHTDRPYYSQGMCRACYQKFVVAVKPITACPHIDKPQFGKGMCQACYIFQHRNRQLATKCEHKGRPNYAEGMCKSCYYRSLIQSGRYDRLPADRKYEECRRKVVTKRQKKSVVGILQRLSISLQR